MSLSRATISAAQLQAIEPTQTGCGLRREETWSPSAYNGGAVNLVDLKRAVLRWAEAEYAPLDVPALDPTGVCNRCRRPISPDAPIDYLIDGSGDVLIVHESCQHGLN